MQRLLRKGEERKVHKLSRDESGSWPRYDVARACFSLLGKEKVQVALTGGSSDLCRANSRDNRRAPEHPLVSSGDKHGLLPCSPVHA